MTLGWPEGRLEGRILTRRNSLSSFRMETTTVVSGRETLLLYCLLVRIRVGAGWGFSTLGVKEITQPKRRERRS